MKMLSNAMISRDASTDSFLTPPISPSGQYDDNDFYSLPDAFLPTMAALDTDTPFDSMDFIAPDTSLFLFDDTPSWNFDLESQYHSIFEETPKVPLHPAAVPVPPSPPSTSTYSDHNYAQSNISTVSLSEAVDDTSIYNDYLRDCYNTSDSETSFSNFQYEDDESDSDVDIETAEDTPSLRPDPNFPTPSTSGTHKRGSKSSPSMWDTDLGLGHGLGHMVDPRTHELREEPPKKKRKVSENLPKSCSPEPTPERTKSAKVSSKTIKGKGKGRGRGRKVSSPRVPMPADRREYHNMNERLRRIELQQQFTILKRTIPQISDAPKASKQHVLTLAIAYINRLSTDGSKIQNKLEEITRQNNKLIAHLDQLREPT